MACKHAEPNAQVWIRPYHAADRPEVLRLYQEGLLIGEPDPGDSTADLTDIPEHYFSRREDHFWAAEVAGRVVGMVGVIHRNEDVALLRRLRIDPLWQDTELCCRLIETALDHCRGMGDLKVVLDTHLYSDAARRLFRSLGFMFSRGRDAQGKRVQEFYVNLYQDPRRGVSDGASRE